jgi:hypothetical protein
MQTLTDTTTSTITYTCTPQLQYICLLTAVFNNNNKKHLDLIQVLFDVIINVCMCAGEAREIAQSAIAPALASLLFSDVVGQSQQAAEVISQPMQLFFEFAAESKEDILEQFPVLRRLEQGQVVCGDPRRGDPGAGAGGMALFYELSKRAETETNTVRDEDVQEALRGMFNIQESKQQRKSAPNPWPYVHTPQSLLLMGYIAQHTLQQHTSTSEDVNSQPILLSGDTGTGKTYLLRKYVELLYFSGVLVSHSTKINTWTLSAKFDRSHIEALGKEMRKKMKMMKGKCREWRAFILDEVKLQIHI